MIRSLRKARPPLRGAEDGSERARTPLSRETGEPRRAKPQAELERGATRGAKPPSGSWSGAAPSSRGDVSRRYSVDEKKALVAAYAAAAGGTMDAFA